MHNIDLCKEEQNNLPSIGIESGVVSFTNPPIVSGILLKITGLPPLT